MDKKTLLEVRNVIEDIKLNGINEGYIRELYRLLGNSEIPLIFDENSLNTAAFKPKQMKIIASLSKCKQWTKDMLETSIKHFDVGDEELAKSYLLVSLLAHEIEHSNQKLIADGIKETNYDFKREVYHDIFEVLRMKKYIIPRPISLTIDIVRFFKYKNNAYNMILERNADLEAYNVASLVASEANDSELLAYLLSLRNINLLQGYYESEEGVLKYSYRRLGMMRKYNRLDIPSDLDLSTKIKEGLELSKDERDVAIKTMKQRVNFK